MPGVDDTGNHCDDCVTVIPLPFSVTLYDQAFTSATVGSNGIFAFGTNNNSFTGSCLPVTGATYQTMPFYRDQRTDAVSGCTGCGIFTTTTGTAPNRIFSIEYRTTYFGETSATPTLDYEVNLYESGSPVFDYTYGLINSTTLTGRITSIGLQQNTTLFTQYACDTTGQNPPVSTGQQLTATLLPCASPTPTGTPSPTPTCTPGGYSVLIVEADGGTQANTLRNDLLAAGASMVDFFEADSGTPSLAQLQQYQIVVPFSNFGYADPVALGDNLADYMDAGGVVVAFNFDWFGGAQSIQGRWLTGNYTPFDNPGTGNFVNGTLGSCTFSPLCDGVTTLNAFFREIMTVASGATQAATWNDGTPLMAYKDRAVAVSAYVGDFADMWSGDFAKIIMNAGGYLYPCGSPTPQHLRRRQRVHQRQDR